MSLKFVRFCVVQCLIVFAAGCASQAPPPPISVAVSPQATAISTGQTVHFAATVDNDDMIGVSWSATVGTIDTDGNYTAPSGTQSTAATVTATSKKNPTKSASATIHVVAPAQVSATANPQVALYSISPGAAGNVSVQFGSDLNYGWKTWAQPVPQSGGAVSLFVAGMKANRLITCKVSCSSATERNL